jgi:protein-S-isoprenylcysteine O-methyltransferase Ste14
MMPSPLPHPGVRFPPPLLFAAGFVSGLALERWFVRIQIFRDDLSHLPLTLGGTFLITAGLGLTFWGLVTFWRARTAVLPIRPARQLVSRGPYQFSRNPMYTGLSALYVGLAMLFDVAWPLAFLPIVIVALYSLVIRREERYLMGAFGDEYAAYRRRVRRWL